MIERIAERLLPRRNIPRPREASIATVNDPEAVCKNLKNGGKHMVFTEDGDLIVLKVSEDGGADE